MSRLLDAVVERSGLSPIFAKRMISRAILRCGLDPEALQPRDIERVLPELGKAIGVYLDDGETQKHLAAIRGLGNGSDGQPRP